GLPGVGVPEHELFARAGDDPASIGGDLAAHPKRDSEIAHALTSPWVPEPKIGEKIVRGDPPAASGGQAVPGHWKVFRDLAGARGISVRPKPERGRHAIIACLLMNFANHKRAFVRREFLHDELI